VSPGTFQTERAPPARSVAFHQREIDAVIRVDNLAKTYAGTTTPAVDDVSFTVAQGGFYTLLGPSGCGKTTTLRCIAGLERPDRGTIQLGETVVVSDRVFVPTNRRDIGMVFQSYAVWPHMTVFENAAFPLRVGKRKVSKSQLDEKVMNALELVGLTGFEKRMATQLSGGQQQRLSVARALVREPDVLLLDEPLSNLDAKLRERMRSELLLIQRRVGITTLFVTHDQIEALSMSERIAVMDGGKIVQEGSPREIYHDPANAFVAGFIGSTNLLSGKVGARDEATGLTTIETAAGALAARVDGIPVGEQAMVSIRPEDVIVHRGTHHAGESTIGPNHLAGTIEIGLFVGISVEYHVRVEGEVIQARVSSRIDLQPGDATQIELPPDAIHVFRLGGERARAAVPAQDAPQDAIAAEVRAGDRPA
jgi:iron(III) transport system ATP-binding protein